MTDLRDLLETLQSTSDDDLRKVFTQRIGGRTPHDRVLEAYVDVDEMQDRLQWAACVRRFVDLGLPYEGKTPVLYALLQRIYDPTPGQTLDLMERYLRRGDIQVDERYPFPRIGQGAHDAGVPHILPLAAAIQLDSPDAARLFLDNGASLELGYVDAEHPHEQAGAYAAALQSQACLAVVREFEMKQVIGEAAKAKVAPRRKAAI